MNAQPQNCKGRLRVSKQRLPFVGKQLTDSPRALRTSADGGVHEDLAGGTVIYTRDYDQEKLS